MDQEHLGKLLRLGGAAATVGVVACVHAAAGLMPLGQITVRAMMATETAISTAISFTLIVALCSAPTSLLCNWIWPEGEAMWILLAAGVFGALNLVIFAESLARAPVSVLAPLDYTGLIWALLVDWFFFSVQPGGLSLLGSLFITAGALCVVWKGPRSIRPKPMP